MSDSLVDLTKKAMGYVEEVRRCDRCVNHEEQDDSVIDRMWHDVCTFSSIANFRVNGDAVCNEFEKKER